MTKIILDLPDDIAGQLVPAVITNRE